jgi:hypothetical protein
MKIAEGNIVLLGNAKISNTATTYSVIEIGDQILQKIVVPNSLDNFLSRALAQQGRSKLYLSRKVLCGVETPDGKVYCYKAKPISGLIMCIVGIPLIPFFGVGLMFIWQGAAELSNYGVTSKLKAKGATALSL